MLRILIIFLLIAALLLFISSRISKAVRKIFNIEDNPGNLHGSGEKNNEKSEVLYEKDDIVVMKGEAKKKKKDD